jgi:hypothetical protein
VTPRAFAPLSAIYIHTHKRTHTHTHTYIQVRELVRNNRRMEKSIAEITVIKDKALAEVAALSGEREALLAKMGLTKTSLRHRDFLQERVDKLTAQLKDVNAQLLVSNDTVEEQRQRLEHQAKLLDRPLFSKVRLNHYTKLNH